MQKCHFLLGVGYVTKNVWCEARKKLGLCIFQPFCRGGSLSFVPNGRAGPCVFLPLHFEMLRGLVDCGTKNCNDY